MGSIFNNIFTPDAEIDVITYRHNNKYYMKWIIENKTMRTVIPMIGPIAPVCSDHDVFLEPTQVNAYGEGTEFILHTPYGMYGVRPTDFHITDWDGKEHFVKDTPLATVTMEPPKKKMTLREIEKELGYKFDLVEERRLIRNES